MSTKNKNEKSNEGQKKKNDPSTYDSANLSELEKEAEKERTRKPGSQSNSSDQHNNGRGGGK